MNQSATLVLKDLTALADGELVSSAIAGHEAPRAPRRRRARGAGGGGREPLRRRHRAGARAPGVTRVSPRPSTGARRGCAPRGARGRTPRRHAVREHALVYGTDGEPRELLIESRRLTPEQESEREERRAEIESVVRLLPAAYRELIVLRHSHDLSYDEIAEVTGLPLGTVKNRLFRARDAMRSEFVRRGIAAVSRNRRR